MVIRTKIKVRGILIIGFVSLISRLMGGVIIKLIICGNGLDIHVGLNTSYRAYRDYLVNKKIYEGESAISIIEKSDFFIPRDKDCWTDLENALTFDYRKYITQYIDAFDRDIDVNNYETSIVQMNSAKQFFKNNPQDIARDFTNNWFWEWIAREYYNNIKDIYYKNSNDSIHEVIDRDCICINFNYTHTLEDMFDINKTNVLYIHNRLPDKRNLNDKGIDFERDILALAKKQFQFGSVNNYLDEWINFANSIKLKSSQKLMSKKSLIDNLKEIYYAFSKKLSMNYDVLSKFIDENKTKITEVIVLGHSMLGVDEPYYRDVIVPKLKDVHWDVYWHKFDDASIFIEKYKLPEAKSKEW